MADPTELQYWDSCLYINFLTNLDQVKATTIAELFGQAEGGKLGVIVSNLVLVEVRPVPGSPPDYRQKIDALLSQSRPFFNFYGLSRSISLLARDIGEQFPPLTVPDTVHVATALEAGASRFFTYDGDHSKARRRSGDLLRYDGQIGPAFGKPPLAIQVPFVRSGPLDDALEQVTDSQATTGPALQLPPPSP